MNTLEKQAVINKLASVRQAICYVLRQRLMSKQAEGGLMPSIKGNVMPSFSPLNSGLVGSYASQGMLADPTDPINTPFEPQRLQFQERYSTPASRAQASIPTQTPQQLSRPTWAQRYNQTATKPRTEQELWEEMMRKNRDDVIRDLNTPQQASRILNVPLNSKPANVAPKRRPVIYDPRTWFQR